MLEHHSEDPTTLLQGGRKMTKITIIHSIAVVAREAKIIDEIAYRDYCIYEKYLHMKREKIKNTTYLLSDEFALSPEAIYKIIEKQKELRK